jgi:hypothetical protein
MSTLTLTGLIPDMIVAKSIISRELVGFIPGTTINGGSERAAKGQTIKSVIVPVATQGDRTASMTMPTPSGQTITGDSFSINNDKSIKIAWEGEDVRAADMGAGYSTIYGQQLEQALRTHVNAIETLTAQRLMLASSRAYGTPGTTPFATAGDFTDSTFTKKILLDNGMPDNQNSLVMNTAAGATLTGKQASANIAGTDTIQRQGIILPLSGLDLRQSAQVQDFTAGAMASATVNNTGYAAGATVLTLAAAGTGLVVAGDIVTFAGDTNKYVIASVVFAGANPAAGDTITIQDPGLRVAMSTATKAITVVGSSARNIAFNRSSVEVVCRAPVMPNGERDAAVDSRLVVDERSGLAFDVRLYEGYGAAFIDVVCVYDVKVWNPKGVATLLG